MNAISQMSGGTSQMEFNPFSSNLNEHLVFSNEGKGGMNTQELREELADKINNQLVSEIFGNNMKKEEPSNDSLIGKMPNSSKTPQKLQYCLHLIKEEDPNSDDDEEEEDQVDRDEGLSEDYDIRYEEEKQNSGPRKMDQLELP